MSFSPVAGILLFESGARLACSARTWVSVPLPGFFYLKVREVQVKGLILSEFQSRCRDSFI